MDVTFVPHLVPLDRGILETIYARLAPGVDASAIERTLGDAYADSPFVRLTGSDLPEIKHVAHTNYCDIGWRVERPGGQLVMISCIDNLVKGAAGRRYRTSTSRSASTKRWGSIDDGPQAWRRAFEDASAVHSAAGHRPPLRLDTAHRRARRRTRDSTPSPRTRRSPHFVDGLRITDEAALDAVVSVLAGRTNTTSSRRLVGGRACRRTDGRRRTDRLVARRRRRTVSGEVADLGLVGEPDGTDASLLNDLVGIGCIPVVASIGMDADGCSSTSTPTCWRAPGDHRAGQPAHCRGGTGGRARRRRPNGTGTAARGHRRDDGVGRRAFGNGGETWCLPSRVRERRYRYIYCAGQGRGRLHDRGRYSNRIARGDEGMTTATSNVVALETEHVLQVYKRNPVVFERGRGCRLFDAAGRGYP